MMKHNPHIKRLEELVLFALFGAMMFMSAQVDLIPNFHPLALFIVAFTLVYRFKALIPIYVYVMLEGLIGGFNLWWMPYLYIWTVLWAMAMLIPRRSNELWVGLAAVFVAALHGICFGLLYAPFQCYAMYGGDWSLTLTWMVNGALFDTVHMVGNLTSSLLVIPLVRLLFKLSEKKYPFSPLTSLRNKK
jgi:energy-coupling factor transport system substrate-specific component